MRKVAITVFAVALAACQAASPPKAPASNQATPAPSPTPSFIAAPTIKGGDMTNGVPVAFKEVGLRPGQAVRYQLTANASADYQCMTTDSYYGPSGTGPSHAASGQVSAAAEFTASGEGTIAQVLTLPYAPAPAVSCPPGSELGRWRYSFTNVLLHDMTNGIAETLPAPGGEA